MDRFKATLLIGDAKTAIRLVQVGFPGQMQFFLDHFTA